MIRSFGSKATEDFYHGRRTAQARRIATDIRASALRMLDMLNAASVVDDLRSPLVTDWKGSEAVWRAFTAFESKINGGSSLKLWIITSRTCFQRNEHRLTPDRSCYTSFLNPCRCRNLNWRVTWIYRSNESTNWFEGSEASRQKRRGFWRSL